MTDDEARSRIEAAVPRETLDRLEQLAGLVADENQRQNLVSPATLPIMWSRHILDSVQLAWLSDGVDGDWLDIGTGAGFPGLVVGLVRQARTILVEPRTKRAAFLSEAAAQLGIADRISVIASRVETAGISNPVSIVSARAVAALPALFGMAHPYTSPETLWLLPKGRSAADEVAEARVEWQGDIKLVPSLSDPESAIVVARGVRRKRG